MLRSSEKFIAQWIVFIKLADLTATPILYQHLADILFRKLLNDQCTVASKSTSVPSAITEHEKNAISYAAGFACWKLRKKIKRSAHKYKNEMVMCLMDLTKDSNDKRCGNYEEWTVKINRRGLCRIKEATHSVFLAIEEVLKECLHSLTETPQRDKIIIRNIITNDDVDFYWLIAYFKIHETEELLYRMVELYVTVRGFSYASAWLEKYKQRTKKSM